MQYIPQRRNSISSLHLFSAQSWFKSLSNGMWYGLYEGNAWKIPKISWNPIDVWPFHPPPSLSCKACRKASLWRKHLKRNVRDGASANPISIVCFSLDGKNAVEFCNCSANQLIVGFFTTALGRNIYGMNLVIYTPFLSNLGIVFGFVYIL